MTLLLLMTALVQAPAPPTPIRIYFVGNSHTFTNNLPALVAELGRALDPPQAIEVAMAARDGMTLEQHWKEGAVARRLRREKWHFLVLQEQSSRPLTNPALTERYLRRFAGAARAAGAEAILLQAWPRADDPDAEPRLAAFRRVAKAAGVRLAPAGEAWRMARRELPAVQLHAEDGLHPNRAGSYLSAAVLLGMLARRSPEDLRPLKSGDPDSAAALRVIARRALATPSGPKERGTRASQPARVMLK